MFYPNPRTVIYKNVATFGIMGDTVYATANMNFLPMSYSLMEDYPLNLCSEQIAMVANDDAAQAQGDDGNQQQAQGDDAAQQAQGDDAAQQAQGDDAVQQQQAQQQQGDDANARVRRRLADNNNNNNGQQGDDAAANNAQGDDAYYNAQGDDAAQQQQQQQDDFYNNYRYDGCPQDGTYSFQVKYKLPSAGDDQSAWLATAWTGTADIAVLAEEGNYESMAGYCTLTLHTDVTANAAKQFQTPTAQVVSFLVLAVLVTIGVLYIYCRCCASRGSREEDENVSNYESNAFKSDDSIVRAKGQGYSAPSVKIF